MKKLLTLTSLLAIVFLAGCGTKTATTTPSTTTTTASTTQTFDGTGFSIQYPTARTVKENVYGASVMFFSPQLSGDQFRENVGIVTEILPTDMAIADYYTSIKAQLTNMIKDYQELSNEDITIGDVTAKKIVYVGTQSNYKLKWMQVLVIKNKVAYVINYTASAATFDQFSKEADAMVKSFVLK
ncbi:MAG: DcrB-related protein [candidate division SR1 bacterium]|nr:DcrB-related protein [candidate division SR1 bacterium]